MEEQNIKNVEQEEFLPPTPLQTVLELFIRLFVLLGTTVLISVSYKLVIETGIFGLIADEMLCRIIFCVTELLLLALYWYYIFMFSKISRHRTYSLKAYYTETGIVFTIFSVIYLLSYIIIGREKFLWFFRVTVNLIGFRFLTYAPESLKYYMLAYLAVTALVMALEPWIAKSLFEKWEKEVDESIQNPGELKQIPAIWQSISEIFFRLSVIFGVTILVSAIYNYLINAGLFSIIKNENIGRIVFCVIELLLLVVCFSLAYDFSILSRFRSLSVKSYYFETGVVFAVFSLIYILSYKLLSRDVFLWLFRVTINLIGLRFTTDIPASLKVYMLAFLGIMFLIMNLEPLIAWILFKREESRMNNEQKNG